MLDKCLVSNCENDIYIKKRNLCKYHYSKYYQCGIIIYKSKKSLKENNKIYIGSKFNNLIAIKFVGRIDNSKHNYWEFKCHCGETKLLKGSLVKNGYIKNCSYNCYLFYKKYNNILNDLLQLNIALVLINKQFLHLEDKYGTYLIKYRDFIRGVRPCISNVVDKNNYIVNKSIDLYGDKYIYNLTNYIDSKTKIIITCKEHGDYSVLINDHLGIKKRECINCKKLIKARIKF